VFGQNGLRMKLDAVHRISSGFCENRIPDLMEKHKRLTMIGVMRTDDPVSAYLAKIGRKGGTKSRRSLSPEDARNMVRVREAQRAFLRFYAQCFWYLKADMKVTLADIPEIIRGLRKNGGRTGFILAGKLCR